jgi:RNA polymerase sigma-70 factor (ECF subfamily)
VDLRETFADLFEEYQRPLYYFLLRMTKKPDVPEDLTQERFIRVHRGLSGFRWESSFSIWISRIAANASLDYSRSRASLLEKTTITPDEVEGFRTQLLDPAATSHEFSTTLSEMFDHVQRFILDLHLNCRAPLMLSDLQGWTNRS